MQLDFPDGYVAGEFLKAIIYGPKPEIACFGARGDGKTTAFLAGTIFHAAEHQRRGHPLPVPWMGVTDTFTSHKLKTLRTMEEPLWAGGWRLSDNDHVATYVIKGQAFAHLDLFGIEDQGAMDRVRMATVGMWFEEPAPSAVLVQSSGIREDAWMLGRTSQRVPSHFHPAVATINYPDEDHWTWQRFVERKSDEVVCFRVPPGERASKDQRDEWARALADRPDMLRRLIEGKPGVILLGEQVAQGFNMDTHVSHETLRAAMNQPLYLGFDFGHTPTCIIGQQDRGRVNVLASLFLPNSGMRQLMDELVMPWLGRYAPWCLKNPDEFLLVGYDPSGATTADADQQYSAIEVIKEIFDGGWYEPGPVKWANRRNALTIFHRASGILFDKVGCADLIKACNGRWYYAKNHQGDLRSDQPKKPNHPWEDLGDGLIYMLCRMGVTSLAEDYRTEGKVITNNNYAA